MNQFIERTSAVRDFARLDNGFDERHQQKGRASQRGADRCPRRSRQSCQIALLTPSFSLDFAFVCRPT
jgi:hypothetical protein